MILQRIKKDQNTYKALLVQKIVEKSIRADQLSQSKNQLSQLAYKNSQDALRKRTLPEF